MCKASIFVNAYFNTSLDVGESATTMTKPEHAAFSPVSLSMIEIDDAFWSPRQLLMSTTLLHQYENFERFCHVDNFRLASGVKQSAFVGMFYYDSDLYKWLEASTYSLYLTNNDALRENVEAIVELVIQAQSADGYINTYFTTNFPDERMKYFYTMHEMYCGGHLIEAAVARYMLEGIDDLLGVARKFADFLITIDPDAKNADFVPGHQEIELALIKLFRCTGDKKYLDLAIQLMDKRGHNPHLTRTALKNAIQLSRLLKRQDRNLSRWEANHGKIETPAIKQMLDTAPASLVDKLRFVASFLSGRYEQQHVPVRDQRESVGHAVRAMYMYSAMTDIYMETGDAPMLAALQTMWKSMTEKRMYITGGVGSLPLIEGFGRDHELDNKKAYCETCAAIGNFLWNWRMLQATGDPRHADLMERILYNAILAGWSLDGTKYRYANPLATSKGLPHQEWYSTACCPPNIGRIVSSLGQYVASTDGTTRLWIHQYIGSKLDIPLENGSRVSLTMGSEFPWLGYSSIKFNNKPPGEFTIELRVPSWAYDVKILINGTEIVKQDNWGIYIPIMHDWILGDEIKIEFSGPPDFILPDPRVKANRGRVAIQRGPIIYAIEAADNSWFRPSNLAINITEQLQALQEPNLLGGITTVSGTGISGGKRVNFKAIPYYTYGNRALGPMEVWIKAKK